MTSEDLRLSLYRAMCLIRSFEESALGLFSEGKLAGTTHACIGQEAIAVSMAPHLRSGDCVFSNHRCHGHYLAITRDITGLMAEMMGKRGGVCGGRGGSQHLCSTAGIDFYTNGIQGSILPVAAGMAFAESIRKTGAVGVVFMGDGTLGQGVVYETFNLVSLWSVPLLVIIENNGYAQSTPTEKNLSGAIALRSRAFGLETNEVESNDAEELYDVFRQALRSVRNQRRPRVQVVNTYRLCAHSKGDDHRPQDEIDAWRERDPLLILASRLDKAVSEGARMWARREVARAVEEAEGLPDAEEV